MGWRCDVSKNGSFVSCLDPSSRGLCWCELELEFFVFLGTRTRILGLGLPFLLLYGSKKVEPKRM